MLEFVKACLKKDPAKRADCQKLLSLRLIKTKKREGSYFTDRIRELVSRIGISASAIEG